MIRRIFCYILVMSYVSVITAGAQTIKGKSIQNHTIKLSGKDNKTDTDTLTRIVYLSEKPYESSDTAVKSCYFFLSKLKGYSCDFMTAGDLGKHTSTLKKYKIIVYLKDEKGAVPSSLAAPKTLQAVNSFLKEGGSMLLSGFALHYLNDLGLESVSPYDSLKPCNDEGVGRKLGFHALFDHPVFSGMNGGAYILRPMKDQVVGVCGYFGSMLPKEGKVVGVDWDYIFLREESKVIMEYKPGMGKVLAVGGYMDFSQPNLNLLHLEKFTSNCLDYLTHDLKGTNIHYWDYSHDTIMECRADSDLPVRMYTKPSSCWEASDDPMNIVRRFSSDEFWDVAGERLLTMGTENGGIEEVWSHPFMAMRDYEVGIKFDYKDTIYWLKDQRPEVISNPAFFTRIYKFPRAYLKEIIVNDPVDPAGVLHYEYKGVYGAEMFVRFRSNFRWMWPYSAHVTGSLCHTWMNEMQAFRLTDKSGMLNLFVGASKRAVQKLAGQFDSFSIDKNYKATGNPTCDFMVSVFLEYKLEMTDQVDVIYVAGSEGTEALREGFIKYQAAPEQVFTHSYEHSFNLFRERLMITTPDASFNKGYRWAVSSADKFFVNTPGLGKSLVAGYASSKHGWDGAQKVSGRPGYAWYFGRDGQWSGFALLDEGDYTKVRSELEFYQKYQDLNGKILHEASTSGIVHYDASDATPLYIILAGRYFRYSNDTAFLRQSWPCIRKALDFCFSTDTDKDHLIENTNVGHGWVEGGELYGSHATFYMAGCWSEALKEAANMSSFMKDNNTDKYREESMIVEKVINKEFWNPSTSFFNYGKNADGSFRAEPTVLPAVPLGFGLADRDKAESVLQQFASNSFTTNWGVRIVRDDSKLFKPTGYHYGSVWPLFTGWASMAEYRYGNAIQGYSHLMNNLNVYSAWSMGTVQEVLNGAVYSPSGVCANQCWSETMVLQPALEGLLGLDVDAGKNLCKLAPALPADWDSMEVNNIRTGNKLINMKFRRKGSTISYHFTSQTKETPAVELKPLLPPGTQAVSCRLNQHDIPFTTNITPGGTTVKLDFRPGKEDLVEIEFRNGISVLPVVQAPRPGYSSEGLRIINAELSGKTYNVLAENKPLASGEIHVWISDMAIDHIENGTLLSSVGNLLTIRIDFPDKGKKYTEVPLKIFLK